MSEYIHTISQTPRLAKVCVFKFSAKSDLNEYSCMTCVIRPL